MSDQNSAVAVRARFWRRVFAIFIDGLVVSLIVGLLGLALFAPTGGKVRVSNVVVSATYCRRPDVNASEFSLPRDFKVTSAGQCTSQFLGHVYDRFLVISEVTQSGAVTYTRTLQYPIDADGHPISAFYLDYLLPFLFAGYLVLLEWKQGSTIGKGLLGLQVRSLDGSSLTFVQAAKRTAIRFIPVYPLLPIFLVATWTSPAEFFNLASYMFMALAVSAVLTVVMGWNFIAAVRRGELPWHDRWAGTEVVR